MVFERENWPYVLVVAVGIVSWTISDFVDSTREIATADYNISAVNMVNTTIVDVEFENISRTRRATNFDIIIRAGDIDTPAKIEKTVSGQCGEVSYRGIVFQKPEPKIECLGGDSGLRVPINALDPDTGLQISATFLEQNAEPTLRVDVEKDSMPIRVVSRRTLTSFFLRNEGTILGIAVILSIIFISAGLIINIVKSSRRAKGQEMG